MFRWSITLIGTMVLLGCIAAAQDSPSHMFSSDLVAWSGMQHPTSPEQQPQRQLPPRKPVQPAPSAAPGQTEI